MPAAKLALENGAVFTGKAFGALGDAEGEVVFNTSMTGYQEILTDPSYNGQIVAMTSPQIGNYGVTAADAESRRPWVRGFIVRELSATVSNHRAGGSLRDYLLEHNIPALEGIDTRALVRMTREQGALKGVVSSSDLDDRSLVERARKSPGLVGLDLTRDVIPETSLYWDAAADQPRPAERGAPPRPNDKPRVLALDFGMKWNIARCLVASGFAVTIIPGNAPAEEILERKPDGIFISNGPGDPGPLTEATKTLRTLVTKACERDGTPIFGICLGHQLLGQAFGAKTFKLKFGHRGANHPVRDERTGRVEITTQNHGFAVDPETLPADIERSHINLNDMTLEGLRHKRLPILSVQYHPEASAGPHDSRRLFDEFRAMIPG